MKDLKVALVHEWLISWGGSESVLLSLSRLFPGAPIFTSIYAPDSRVRLAFAECEIEPGVLQLIPGVQRLYRGLLPLMPWAFKRMDLKDFDLVISSSHAFAKAISVAPDAYHLCYCHTPPRYLWDLYDSYNPGLQGVLGSPLLKYLKRKDFQVAKNVSGFIANSAYVADRIARSYGRDATVVYPPVDVDQFDVVAVQGSYYLAGGRMVKYKRLDKAIEAANRGKLRLIVFGDGPERARLTRLAGPTVEFTGGVTQPQLAELIRHSRAFLFPGVEDFGILPVEVQAGGRPVIALAQGGALETVKAGVTGLLYEDDSVDGLLDAVHRFEPNAFNPMECRLNALRFSRDRFEKEMAEIIRQVSGRT